MAMIRNLSKGLRISAEVLIQPNQWNILLTLGELGAR
jgi:hypothetical protein